MFIEIDEKGYATGAWSETQQDWATFEVDELPEDLNCYQVKNDKLVYNKLKKAELKSADDNEKLKQNLIQYLKDTDWMVIRYMETGKEIPDDISKQRQTARDKLSALEQEKDIGAIGKL
jgi:hypothetical protein